MNKAFVNIGIKRYANKADIELILKIFVVIIHINNAARPTKILRVIINPNPVATPFPPLNLSQTGKQWPITAPTATKDWRSSKSITLLIKKKLKNKLVINIAKAPFPPSRISVSRAFFFIASS